VAGGSGGNAAGGAATAGQASGGTETGGIAAGGTATGGTATGGRSTGGFGGRATGGGETGGTSVAGGTATGGTAEGGTGGRTATGGRSTGGFGGRATGGGETGGTSVAGGTAAGGTAPTCEGGLACTPPMGWNSWNKFGCNIDDKTIRAIADSMVSSGMKDAGYQYVNIDDCWQTSRDGSGTIVPGSNFPDMKALADYVHDKGLKLGVYSDRGTKTCAGRPGGEGHETQDANTYASWGVDYLKYDNCNATQDMKTQYTTMGNALKACGRPIVFSICAWGFQSWMPSVGNLWRTTGDINASWSSITGIIDTNADLAQHASPGHWNDPDMLEVGNGSLTENQNKAHFGMWAIMAAPLIAGNDLRSMSTSVNDILTASEVIAVDQDLLGVQGTRVKGKGSLEVWKKKLYGTNTVAVGLLNRTNSPADITVTWADAGLPSGAATVRDLWAKSDLGSFTDTYTAKAVPSNGMAMLKITSQ
jgi:alpha-galactosidase